jgi:hypothetical protein
VCDLLNVTFERHNYTTNSHFDTTNYEIWPNREVKGSLVWSTPLSSKRQQTLRERNTNLSVQPQTFESSAQTFCQHATKHLKTPQTFEDTTNFSVTWCVHDSQTLRAVRFSSDKMAITRTICHLITGFGWRCTYLES